MPDKNKQFLVCNCERTMRLDGEAIGRALGMEALEIHSQLCRTGISTFESELKGQTQLCVSCTQEAPLFSEIAAEMGRPEPAYVNIREMAAWSANRRDLAPKVAALLSAGSLEPSAPVRNKTISSDGLCLVYGSGQAALHAARLLNKHLSVTLVLEDAADIVLPPVLDIPIFSGRLAGASGTLGSFEITVDRYAAMLPSSRDSLQFAMARDGAKSRCSVLVDLSGGAPLFSRPEGRDGYFRANPGEPLAVFDALLKAGDYAGEFEKPIYVTYDAELCAHSRSQKTGCAKCIDNCPPGAISPSGDNIEIDTAICGGCGNCAAHCPTGAAQYQYPMRADFINKIQILASVYLDAGGSGPLLLLHDGDHGLQVINVMARFMKGLPAHVIPLEMHSVTAIGHDAMIAALAAGFRNILVLADPKKADETGALEQEIILADALLEGLGFGTGRIQVISEADPEKIENAIWAVSPAPQIAAKAFSPIGTKRDVARAAIGLLTDAAGDMPDVIALPQSAPYGRVNVDNDACTLCMSCVSACPADALRDTPEVPELRFVESACVQCGLCEATCPEDAISLERRINLTPAAMQPVTLYAEEPFECKRCGKPFAARSTIERVAEKLGGKHWMFESDERIALLKMCDNCRLEVLAEKTGDPFAIASRPRTRTTDDYLEAEKSGLSIEDFIKGR